MPQKVVILVLSHGILANIWGIRFRGVSELCFPSTVLTHGSFFISNSSNLDAYLSSKLDFKAFLHLDPAWLLGHLSKPLKMKRQIGHGRFVAATFICRFDVKMVEKYYPNDD